MTWGLPSELVDIIIHHCHNDPATLATCALVQKSWVPRARYHFWRELHLTCTKEELEKVGSMLDESPDIAFYVRDVILSQNKGEACQSHDFHLLRSALYILARFPSLTSVKFDGLWFGAPKDSENAPHRLTFPTVYRLCVSNCTFDAFDDVQQLCAAFPALSRLQFDGVWCGHWAADRGFASGNKRRAKPLMLRELDLGSCFSRDCVIDWLLATLPGPSIGCLRLPLVSASDTRLRELLQFVGPSLHHLELGPPSSSTAHRRRTGVQEKPLTTYLDMSHNTGLHTIQLGVPTYRDAAYISLWLKTILGQIASPLQEVRFAIYPVLMGDAPDANDMLRAFAWKDIASILQNSQFAKLKRVVFVSARSKDYLNVPGAFVALQPLLRKIMVPEFVPLAKQGVEIAFEGA